MILLSHFDRWCKRDHICQYQDKNVGSDCWVKNGLSVYYPQRDCGCSTTGLPFLLSYEPVVESFQSTYFNHDEFHSRHKVFTTFVSSIVILDHPIFSSTEKLGRWKGCQESDAFGTINSKGNWHSKRMMTIVSTPVFASWSSFLLLDKFTFFVHLCATPPLILEFIRHHCILFLPWWAAR